MSEEQINLLLQNVIAYHPVFKLITKNTNAAILLSQLVYLHRYWLDREGKKEFWATDKELMQATCCSQEEITNAKKLLEKLGFIKTERKGIPAKTHYIVNMENIKNAIKNQLENNRLGILPNLDLVKARRKIQGNNESNTYISHRQRANLSRERENCSYEDAEVKKLVLQELSQYIDPKRLELIGDLSYIKLDYLLFLFEQCLISESEIKNIYAYVKTLKCPENYIEYEKRREIKQQLQRQLQKERLSRSKPPEDIVDPIEVKKFTALLSGELRRRN